MKVFVQSPSGKEKVITSEVGKTVKIKAVNGAKYQFIDEVPSPIAKKVNAKKAGKNLEIFIDNDEIADIVIENYYSEAKVVPEILNDSSLLEAQVGTITLDSTPNAIFLTPFEPSLYTLAAIGGAAGMGAIVAGSGSGSAGGDMTPPALVTTDGADGDTYADGVVPSGAATTGITITTHLPSNVVVGDKIITILKNTGTGQTIMTLEHIVTQNDINNTTYDQTFAPQGFGIYTTTTYMQDAAGNKSSEVIYEFDNALSGVLSDDYLAYATVFVDSDNDGQLDWTDSNSDGVWNYGEGEAWTTTDSEGQFSFTIDPNGAPIVAVGGVDTASGIPSSIVYKMYSAAVTQVLGTDIVISPLSTLIAAVLEKTAEANGTLGEPVTQEALMSAVSTVASAFGLTVTDQEAFLRYDVVKEGQSEASAFNNDLLTLNRQVAVVLSTSSALIDGEVATTNSGIANASGFGLGTLSTAASFADLIVSKTSAGEAIDFTSSSDIETIMSGAMSAANETIAQQSADGDHIVIQATNATDMSTISSAIAQFNTVINTLTEQNGVQSTEVITALRTITESLVPALTQAGAQAATTNGGDISFTDALNTLTTTISNAGDLATYVNDQIASVQAKNEPFIANDIEGIATQLSKIVLQMPTLGVGDAIDTLYISSKAKAGAEATTGVAIGGSVPMELWTVNPVTKVATKLNLVESVDYPGYYQIDPAVAGYLYIKTASAVNCYLDVKAENTVNNVLTEYSGTVHVVMEPLITTIVPLPTIDTVADNVGTAADIARSGKTNDDTPTISGKLNYTLGTGETLLDPLTVKIYDGSTYLGDANVTNTAGVLTWTFTSGALNEGSHSLVARVIEGTVVGDAGTVKAASNPYLISVDTSTAEPTINPTDGKLITGTAEAGATVTIKNEAGTETIGTAVADATGKWSLSITNQLADTSKVQAMATDSVGNESGYSGLTTVEWNTPTTLVTLVSVNDNFSPVTGHFATASHTNDATPTFSGTLSAPLSVGESLAVYNGDTLLGTATVNGTSWTFTPSALTDGNYTVNAVVTNGSRDGKKSADFTFTVDTVTPTQLVTLTNVDDDVQGITGTVEASSTTNDSKPTFSGTLDNELGVGEQVIVYDTNGGKTVQIGYATVSGTEWTFTPKSSLAEGLHKIEFTIIDKAGNETAKQSAFTFTVDTVVGVPTINTNEPHMTTVAEESGTIVCTMNTPEESATLSIDSATGDGALFSIDEDGVVRAIGLDFESKASYTFTVLATDSAGNTSKKSITVTATNVEEADAIISIVPDSLAAVASPATGETVEVTFTVYRSDDLGVAEFTWSVTGGLSESDFVDGILPSGTVTFEEGATSAVITVEVPSSLAAEKLRQLEVTIETDSDNYRVDTANASATVDVVDFSAVDTQGVRYTVSATNNATVLEGSDGDVTAITYTIRRSSGEDAVGFRIDASGAALISGNDFCDEAGNALGSLPSGNLEFVNDVATVTLYVKGDSAVGPDEQFTFALTGAPIGSKVFGLTSGKIVNDDAYVSVYSEEIPNAASGEVTHKFIVTRSGNTDIEHTVTYSIVAIGENSTDMFDTEDVTLTFAPGETEKEISFTTTGDEIISGYKSFGIELSAGENVTLLNAEAMSTINPNIQDVEITTNIDRTLEGGAATFSYTVTRSGDVSEVLELPWQIVSAQENGVSAADFAGGHFPSGVIRFEAGSESATVTFSSAQDTTLEGDEGFMLVLDDTSLPEYIRLINPSVEGVIVDDESAVGFNQSSVFSVVEGDSGSHDLVVTVSRIGFTGNESTVDWAITLQSGTGKAAASDLFAGQALSGTVTFKPGEASAAITIKINGDTTYESGLNETMNVTLSNPSAGTKLIGGTGENGVTYAGYGKSTTATIVNDDSLISVSSPTFSEVEGQGGTNKYLELTIKRDGSTVGSDWVKWSLVSNGDSNSVNNDDLGQPNDAIGVFDSYYNSWIDFASLNGSQSAEGSVTLNRDGYIMVAYNREWEFDNQPFDQFVLNNLSVQGGTLTSMGEVSNFDISDNENTGAISGSADSDGGSWDYTAYAIFKLDVTDANAVVSFDVEQLGRYGIDTGKLSYAPEGSFSTSIGDMIEGNEGSNLLIPALSSPINVHVFSMDNVFSTSWGEFDKSDIAWLSPSDWEGNLYYNAGSTEEPNWISYYQSPYYESEGYIPVEDVLAGKIGYVGDSFEFEVYDSEWNNDYIVEQTLNILSMNDLNSYYNNVAMSDIAWLYPDGDYDSLYYNQGTADEPDWVTYYDSPYYADDEYIPIQDVLDGKIAIIDEAFWFYTYDSNWNEDYAYAGAMTILSMDSVGETDNGNLSVGDIAWLYPDDNSDYLYYNEGTAENPNWVKFSNSSYYDDNGDWISVDVVNEGKIAFLGEEYEFEVADSGRNNYDYIYPEANPEVSAPSEIATQTGEVALDGSGYIWLRYDNDENSGNDGEDKAWINNLHIVDPAGHATIEVVGQKVIKDGVAHEQELGGAGALQLDGIAIKNMPIVDDNGNNLIAITTLQNGTMSTRGTDIYVTDMNDQENDVYIDAAGLSTSTARSGMSTLTSLNATEAKSVIYDETYGSEADRTITLVHGNLTSLASNADVIDPNTFHTITLENLVGMIPYADEYLAEYDYSLDDIYMLNMGYDDEDSTLYFNEGTAENPVWVVWNGDDLLAQDIRDGKLAFSGDEVYLYGAGFSMSDSWDDDGYGNEIYESLVFPSQIITLDELSRSFNVASADFNLFYIDEWYVDDDLYFNIGDAQNPNWVDFWDYRNDYYNANEEYPVLSKQDIVEGKLAYTGDYVSFYGDVYSSEGVYAQDFYGNNVEGNESDSIYLQTHTLTLGDLAKAFGITAGDIDYVEIYGAYADDYAYVNVGTTSVPEWVNMDYFIQEYGELSVNDILEGKVVYSGDYLQINEIYIYDKNGDYLVDEGSAQIRSDFHVITLEDIATMYGNSFSADDIGSVYIDNYNGDDIWYNSGTIENPSWDYYDGETMSAQDIADGKFAYSGNYVELCTEIYDQNENCLVDYDWSDNTLNAAQPNPDAFDTIELYASSEGTLLKDEPAFMHAIVNGYEIASDDTASVLDDTVTLNGELLTFTSTEDLSDRTITISGYVDGSEDLVTETIEAGPNNSTVVSTIRFVTVTSIELSEGANEAELSVGTSIVYGDTMTLFARASVADSDGSITITGLDANGEAKTVVYENILDGLSKSMGEFSEIFALHTSDMNTGSIEFSAVEGDGFADIALNGTRDENGYIVFDEPQRITISNESGANAQNQEFRITGVDSNGQNVVELVEGIMNGGAYISTHYFSKVLSVEIGSLDGTTPTISVGTIGEPVTSEQAMSQYGGEVVVNDSVATFDAPSQITFTSDDNLTSRVFTITGTDKAGNVIVENVTGANGGIAISSHKFMSVSSITVDEGSNGSVKVGYTTSGGMTDNFVITGSGTAADPFVGYSTNTTEGTESDVLLFVNFNGSAPGSVKLSYDLAVQGAANSDTLYVEYSSSITSLLQGKAYFEDGQNETTILIPVAGDDTKEGNEGMTLTLISGSTGTTVDATHNTTAITLLNDDDQIWMSADARSAKEGNATDGVVTFTIYRADAGVAKTVNWSIVLDETTTASSEDFVAMAGTATFAQGQTTATIQVAIAKDRLLEANETFKVELSTPEVGSGYNIVGNAVAAGTIINDDAAITIVANNANAAEGDSSTVSRTYTITRTGDLSSAASLTWNVTGDSLEGTALAADSANFSGSMTGTTNFAAVSGSGDHATQTQTVTLTSTTDNMMTGDYGYTLAFADSTNATDLTNGQITDAIIEDDALNITVSPLNNAEGNTGTTAFTYTLTRTDGTKAATVDWKVALADVDAAANADDFVSGQDSLGNNSGLPSGTATFAEGETTVTVTINIAADTNIEPSEAFTLHVAPKYSSVNSQDFTAKIVGDDEGYSVTASTYTVVEGNESNPVIKVSFIRSGSTSAADLQYVLRGTSGDATDANDFGIAASGTVHFDEGQEICILELPIVADSLYEASEQFIVDFKNGETALASSDVVTITNDDARVSISVNKSSYTEGSVNDGYEELTYTVTREGNKGQVSTVDWKVVAGEGIVVADFVDPSDALDSNGGLPSGTVTFAADETTKTFTIKVARDSLFEADEAFDVVMSNASAGTQIGTGTVNTAVLNDDAVVWLDTANTLSVTEGDPSNGQIVNNVYGNTDYVEVTYTVKRSGNTDINSTVNWSIEGYGDNPANNDIVSQRNGTVAFNAGETEKTFVVWVNKDEYVEANEQFKISLSSPSLGTSIKTDGDTQLATIMDDDIGFRLDPASAIRVVHSEGQDGLVTYTWTIDRIGVTTEAASLSYYISGNGWGNGYSQAWGDRSVEADFYRDSSYWWTGAIPSADSSDFNHTTGWQTLSFASGDTSKELTITVRGDTTIETSEFFRVFLESSANAKDFYIQNQGYTNGYSNYVEGIILRDEGSVGITSEIDAANVNAVNSMIASSVVSAEDNEYDDPNDYLNYIDADSAKAEGDAGAEVHHYFKIFREFSVSGDVNVDWRVSGTSFNIIDVDPYMQHPYATEASADDFVTADGLGNNNGYPSGTITIPDGEAYVILDIVTKGDVAPEDLEAFRVNISNVTPGNSLNNNFNNVVGYIGNDDGLFSVGLPNPDTTVAVEMGSKVVNEADGTVTYRIYRTGDTSHAASVDWAVTYPEVVSGGVSTNDYKASNSDFTDTTNYPLAGTLNFAAGDSYKDVTLKINDDSTIESWAEFFSIELSNAQYTDGYTGKNIGVSQVAGTMESMIVDDEVGSTVAITSAVVNNSNYEGTPDATTGTTITYTLTRSGSDVSTTAQVAWVLEVPANNWADVSSITGDTGAYKFREYYWDGLVTFGANETEKTIVVHVAADQNVEPDEVFKMTLVDARDILEHNYGGEEYDQKYDVWSYNYGSDGSDPVSAVDHGIFLDNTDLFASVAGDGNVPDSGNMYRSDTNYISEVTIKNDDIRLRIDNDSYGSPYLEVYEGDTGTTDVSFTISRHGRVDNEITIGYEVLGTGGTATAGTDYVVKSGTLTLPAGTFSDGEDYSSYNLTIEDVINGDMDIESIENFTIRFTSNDTNIHFGQYGGLSDSLSASQNLSVAIRTDDTTWRLDVDSNYANGVTNTYNAFETNSGTTPFTFYIHRTPQSGTSQYYGSATVNWSLDLGDGDGYANADDFNATSGTVYFGDGEQYKAVTIYVKGDELPEWTEQFGLKIDSVNHGTIDTENNLITAKIKNDDTAISIDNVSVAEGDSGNTTMTFTVHRTGDLTRTSSATYNISNDTASDNDVNGNRTGTVSFASGVNSSELYGEESTTVTININGDTTPEAHETLNVALSGVSNGTTILDANAVGTILNDEAVFKITAGTYVTEGDVTGQLFTISRNYSTTQSQTINWALGVDTNSHSATADDFVGGLISNSVTFADGELSKEIFIASNQDGVAELDEAFKVTISVADGTVGATLEEGKTVAYGVVKNDDAGTVTIENPDSFVSVVATASGAEGHNGTGTVAFTVTRTGELGYDAKVSWHVALPEGMSAATSDFISGTLPSGVLDMPAGQSTFTINVPVASDWTFESDKTFQLVLDTPEPGLSITAAESTGTITNDDALIALAGDVSVNEANGYATFSVSRSGDTSADVTVTWTLAPKVSVLGSGDISGAMSGTVTIAAGQTSADVVIGIGDDYISEGNEEFTLTLSNPTVGASLDESNKAKTLTITNDDIDQLTYVVSPMSQNEGDGSGWTTYAVTVTRKNPTTTLSGAWNVADISDNELSAIVFENANGTFTFEGTNLTTTFNVKVKADDIGDFDKTFRLSLTNPTTNDVSGAEVITPDTDIDVVNDDPAFSVAFSANSFVEGNGAATKLATFVITRSGDASGTASIKWTIGTDENSDSPANLSDFGGYWPSGTAVFLNGETSKTIQVAIAADSTFELSEGFNVTLSNLVSQTAGARIIIDNDTAVIANDDIGVSVEAAQSSINEGSDENNPSVTFTVSAEGVANKTVTAYFVLEGSGLSPVDEFDGQINMDSFFSNYDNFNYGYDDERGAFYVQMKTDVDGYAEAAFDYTVFADNIAGANETLRVRITEVIGGTIDNSQAVVEIINDDTAITSIVNTTVDMKEGNDGTKEFTFVLTRAGSTLASADVSYEIQGFGDNQADGNDFGGAFPSGTVTFEEGSSTATITVSVSGDTTFESNEGFIVVVAKDSPNEVRLAAEINNDDSASLIANGIVTSVKEGTDTASFLTYEIVRNGDNSEPLTVNYKLVDLDGNDINTADYLKDGATGTITIPAGESRVILALETLPDSMSGVDKEFKVQISAAGFADPEAVASSILDDDSGISISTEDVSKIEGNNGATTYTFTVSRTGANLAATTVAWTLAALGINAAADNDFATAMSGSIAFADDQTSEVIEITVNGDTWVENDESFRVTLVSSSDATQKILVATADAVIENDDTISVNNDIIYGGNGADIIDALAGNDEIHGGAGADVIFGRAGDDTIYAEGEDVIYAGSGDDTIVLDADDLPTLIDAGLGFDTLNVTGTLDLDSLVGIIKSVEAIELDGTLSNVTYADIFSMNETHKLYITGVNSDAVELVNGTKMEGTATYRDVTYDVYHVAADTGSNYVELFIQQQII